ncbi:MAG: MGMT family protein [Candidatus Aenigmarchaeota archaeon]|nr:MGMT family protein [Candidatus Aenigmarchaeota archaeon]
MKFDERVYIATKKVPKGRVTTYKEIGLALKTKGYRAIGQALKRNPYAPAVPCHRVVRNDGDIGGYSGNRDDDIRRKIEILRKEGVEVKNRSVDLGRYFFRLR